MRSKFYGPKRIILGFESMTDLERELSIYEAAYTMDNKFYFAGLEIKLAKCPRYVRIV